MQVIKAMLKISGGTASFVDERDNKKTAPSITIGVKTRLVLDLRRDWDDNAAILLPYPYDELNELLSFYVAIDADWLPETAPKLFKTNGIAVIQEGELTLLSVELPALDTVAVMTGVNQQNLSVMLKQMPAKNTTKKI